MIKIIIYITKSDILPRKNKFLIEKLYVLNLGLMI